MDTIWVFPLVPEMLKLHPCDPAARRHLSSVPFADRWVEEKPSPWSTAVGLVGTVLPGFSLGTVGHRGPGVLEHLQAAKRVRRQAQAGVRYLCSVMPFPDRTGQR